MQSYNSKNKDSLFDALDGTQTLDVDSFSVDYRSNDNFSIIDKTFNAPITDRKSKKVTFDCDIKPKQESDELLDDANIYSDEPNINSHTIVKRPYVCDSQNPPAISTHSIHTTKKIHFMRAVMSLLLSIAGVIAIVNYLNIDTFDAIYEENYNDFLLPVVLNDPDPFNSISDLDVNKILSSAVWYTAIFQTDMENSTYDELGRLIVPTEKIVKSASKLFGPEYTMPIQNPTIKTFFELDPTGENYIIKPVSTHSTYLPAVLSKEKLDNDTIILKVGYTKQDDSYWTDSEHSPPPTPEKILNYTLKKDKNTGSMYISSIQTPTDNL